MVTPRGVPGRQTPRAGDIRIVDNVATLMSAALLGELGEATRLDAAIGYFNLRGWEQLADAVDALPARCDDLPKARVLVGMYEPPQHEMRRLAYSEDTAELPAVSKGEVVDDLRRQLRIGLPTAGSERALHALSVQIESGDVEVRIHTAHRLHAKLYLCHHDSAARATAAFVGSSNLTGAGLNAPGELNLEPADPGASQRLVEWFEDCWNDPLTVPAVPELLEALKACWAAGQRKPYYIYLRMAYCLSEEARRGDMGGIPDLIAADLLDFQAAAARIAAKLVMSRGGAMIGDVVGLGKTREAVAVAGILQQQHNYETLVICPKNLKRMWEEYLYGYGVRGQVVSLPMARTELERTFGHGLVVIDESHHLRNPKRHDYKAIKEYRDRYDSKVLLLTATPYNKQYDDLYAQLSLFVKPGDDIGVAPPSHANELFPGYGATFAAFAKSDSSDPAWRRAWRSLLALYLIRRTRGFVMDRYAATTEDGRRFLEYGTATGRERYYFPMRIAKEVEHEPAGDDPAALMSSDETLNDIESLTLGRYRMGKYLDEGYRVKSEAEQTLKDDLLRAARGNLAGFTRFMLYKRLSSSAKAFVESLRRMRKRNYIVVHAVSKGLPVPVGPTDEYLWRSQSDQDPEDADEDGDHRIMAAALNTSHQGAYERLRDADPDAIKWAPPGMLLPQLADDLKADIEIIDGMLGRFGIWAEHSDSKLQRLIDIIEISHPSDKVLVFTEYADTAEYLQEALRSRVSGKVGVVTGSSDDPTSTVRRFAPRSNPRAAGTPASTPHAGQQAPSASPPATPNTELRVLVSTDVLAEGQNLQDAHIVVNYDLPWAIIKLIQRAGRVDRIGQTEDEVLVYTLTTTGTAEQEINLRRRIKTRLQAHATLLGSDEEFFGDDEELSVIKADYDAVSDRIEGLDEVDPVSMAFEIWGRAIEEDPDLERIIAKIPDIVYTTRAPAAPTRNAQPTHGVLVHTKSTIGSDAFALVLPDGTAQSVPPDEALRMAECEPNTPVIDAQPNHHDMTRTAVRHDDHGTTPRQPRIICSMGFRQPDSPTACDLPLGARPAGLHSRATPHEG